MPDRLTIALPKGRILKELVPLFDRVGIDLAPLFGETRKLIFDLPDAEMRVMIIRATDVPTYVQYGIADLGVAGSDSLREGAADVYEPLDLGIGRCEMVIAESRSRQGQPLPGRPRVATKYPRLTDEFYLKRGIQVQIIKLYGSIELAAVVGLADQVVDLVSSGETLRQNNLVIYEKLMNVSSRLIVNRTALKLKCKRVRGLIGALRRALESQP